MVVVCGVSLGGLSLLKGDLKQKPFLKVRNRRAPARLLSSSRCFFSNVEQQHKQYFLLRENNSGNCVRVCGITSQDKNNLGSQTLKHSAFLIPSSRPLLISDLYQTFSTRMNFCFVFTLTHIVPTCSRLPPRS